MRGGPVVERPCPLCDSPVREHLVWLRPDQFCDGNPTYRKDVRAVLQLSADDRFPIARCRACGHVYSAQLPGQEFLRAVYEQVIVLGSCVGLSESAQEMARRARYVAELLTMCPTPSARALDFGCGSGPTVGLLSAAGLQALGFDTSAGRVVHGSAGRRVTSSWEDVQAAAPYDIVVCDNVLEHVPNPVEVVSQLGALMRPGSLAYVSVPDYREPALQRRLRVARAGGPVDPTLNPWEHLSYFSLRHLDQLMARAGLRRLTTCEVASAPCIGLRSEPGFSRRVLNAVATTRRLVQYAVTGRGVETPENSVYAKA